LTGEIGTGKTMMLDALVLGLDARTKVARLSHTTISEDELLKLLISELGLEDHGGGKLERLGGIQEFLDEWTAAGRNSVLVVDEAQNLSLPVLEEIRLLSNLRSQGQCSLQIVLAGQPEFRTKLDQKELRQLKQRIGIRYHLTPLSAGETAEYVAHRLTVAGANGPAIFDKGAVEAIFVYTGGVPRMINIVCDRALVAGYGANRHRIGKALILETVEDIEGAGFGASPAAISDDAVPARAVDMADAPPPRPARGSMSAVRVAPDSTDAATSASDPARPRNQTSSRAFPTRARTGVIRTSVKNRVVPAWLFPSLLVVVAVAAIVFSAASTGWWRTLVSPRDGVLPVALVADRKDPVDAGESVTGEDSDVGGVGVDVFAPSDIVVTSLGEVSAGETGSVTGASDEDAGDEAATEPGDPGGIGGTAEEAATRYAGTPAPSATEPDLVDSGQDRPATSGPGGPYRVIVLSSRNEDLASAEVPRLAEQGFSAEVIPVDIGDGGLWYRVAVRGGYPALDSAREVVDELRPFGYDSAWVHRE
jgi:type II secretory pathway predicted ATPase ExeA